MGQTDRKSTYGSTSFKKPEGNTILARASPTSTRRPSPDRQSTPIRHRPPSPLKFDQPPVEERSLRLLDLAKRERALFELKERRLELDHQIRLAETELDLAKRQLMNGPSPLKVISGNSGTTRNATKEKDMEAMQHLVDGVSAIWKDVVQATVG